MTVLSRYLRIFSQKLKKYFWKLEIIDILLPLKSWGIYPPTPPPLGAFDIIYPCMMSEIQKC